MEDLEMNCRYCDTKLKHIFADLGKSPFANSYLNTNEIGLPEQFYPLRAFVCQKCFLVQLDEYAKPQKIFTKYEINN